MDGRGLDDDAVATLRRLGPDAAVVAVPLSYRLRSTLVRLGVEVLSDLSALSEDELADFPGIGRKFIAEIREALAVHGLCLRGDGGAEPKQPAVVGEADALRAELLELLRTADLADEEQAGVARLLGWDGRGGASIRVAAEEVLVSPDRLSAALARVRDHLGGVDPAMPALDSALAVLDEAWPAATSTVAVMLRSRGLSNAPFEPAGVLRAAKLLGRRTDLVIEQGRVPIVTKRRFEDVAGAVALGCMLAVAGRAAATVDDVLAHLAEDHDASRWRILVADLVDADDALEWLDPRRRWFGRTGVTRDVLAVLASTLQREGGCSVDDVFDLLAEDPTIGPGIGRRLLAVICARADAFELDGDRLRARPVSTSEDEPAAVEMPAALEVADIEAAARRAALVEVLRARPETSLAELFATEGDAGAWLRSASIVDLARAALDAGVDRTKRQRGSHGERRTGAAANMLAPPQRREEPVGHAPGSDDSTAALVRPEVALAAESRVPSFAWSSGTAGLSLPVEPRPSVEAPPEDGLPEPQDDGTTAPVGEEDVVAVLRGAPAQGLTIAELEVALGCVRSRVRRIVRQLEASDIVHREGATRWTRYRLMAPGEPRAPAADNGSPRTAPIRRRRGDVEGVRTLYYRAHAGADPQKVAAVVLRNHAITIEYAEGQRPFDALERIMTPDGIVTPRDGLRFWSALDRAFSTSSHFFVS